MKKLILLAVIWTIVVPSVSLALLNFGLSTEQATTWLFWPGAILVAVMILMRVWTGALTLFNSLAALSAFCTLMANTSPEPIRTLITIGILWCIIVFCGVGGINNYPLIKRVKFWQVYLLSIGEVGVIFAVVYCGQRLIG